MADAGELADEVKRLERLARHWWERSKMNRDALARIAQDRMAEDTKHRYQQESSWRAAFEEIARKRIENDDADEEEFEKEHGDPHEGMDS